MEPRIYVYKTTFEEIPDWYWGAHKEDEYGEPYLGSPKTHKWKWSFYTPHLQICEVFPYTDEGWVQAQNIEKQCIKPDLNNPLCLNENVGGLMSLEACRRGAKKLCEIIHAEKDENGKSLHTLKMLEALHEEKDELGRSLHTLKLHEEKDENGKSLLALKMNETLHQEKDELGRSLHTLKLHEEKDELGRSLHTLKLHEEKDENGKSVHAVKSGKASAEKSGNKVVVTFPDGFQQYFKSVNEAARFLCVAENAVRKRIRKGPPSKRSKLAGYRFELV